MAGAAPHRLRHPGQLLRRLLDRRRTARVAGGADRHPDVRRRPGDPDRRLPRTRAAGDGAAGDRALGRAPRLHPERAPGRFRRALGGRTPGDDAGLKAAPRAAWTGSRRSGPPLEWADSGPWPANNDPMQADILDALRRGANEIGRATSELQSLMRISYAVFCLKKNNTIN